MTVLIGGVGGAFLVIIIAIIGICCIVRKIHKNSSPPNTPAHSRPTSQQEPAEMTSVRQKWYFSLTALLSIQWSLIFPTPPVPWNMYIITERNLIPRLYPFRLQEPGVGFFRIRCEGLRLEMFAFAPGANLPYIKWLLKVHHLQSLADIQARQFPKLQISATNCRYPIQIIFILEYLKSCLK